MMRGVKNPRHSRGWNPAARAPAVTDAYLLSLAPYRKGVLATFDRGIRRLSSGDDPPSPLLRHALDGTRYSGWYRRRIH
ncbi:MAG: hypothetical protein JWL71_2105 [Acidobacteria bacterium]|nr:hypothetical protein [Acidobacteriota bacterium]